MKDRKQYEECPASTAQCYRFWCANVDALDRHLSTDRWALSVVTVVVIAYPVARIVIPAVLQRVVPDVLRIVLNLI